MPNTDVNTQSGKAKGDVMGLPPIKKNLSATEFISSKKEKGSYSEYLNGFIENIEKYDEAFKVFKVISTDHGKKIATELDEGTYKTHHDRMQGIPITVKDVLNSSDFPTEHGSSIYEGYTPGNDARVVTDVKRNGGYVIGKTQTAEFAVHNEAETKNPYDSTRTAGTSSSGSAASVALQMAPISLGTQTAGSIIRPASYCGVIGFKPSFGVFPRTAVLKTTDTLDTVGCFSNTVADSALVFDVCRVTGLNYPLVNKHLDPNDGKTYSMKDMRVGILKGPKTSFEVDTLKTQQQDLVKFLEGEVKEVKQFTLPERFNRAFDVHELIYRKALSYYFKWEWNRDRAAFSDILAEMIEDGLNNITTEMYYDATYEQHVLGRDLNTIFDDFDVLITMSAEDDAPEYGCLDRPNDHNLLWTMGLTPSITLPLYTGNRGLPVGAQFVSKRFDDFKLLQFSNFIDQNFRK